MGRIKTSGRWLELIAVPLGFAGLGLLAAIYGLATGYPLREMAITLATVASPFPVFFGAKYLSMFAHEMAHVVAAKSYGLRILQVRVLNLRWVSEGEGDEESTEGGGVHVEETLSTDRPWPATIISLAGPAADLALLGGAAYLGYRSAFPFSIPLWCVAFWSGWGTYISLVPSASGDEDSDIKHVIDQWNPESQLFAYRALQRIWPVLEGADPASVNTEDLRRALWIAEPRWRVTAAQISTYHAIATGSSEGVSTGKTYIGRCREVIANCDSDEDRAAYESLLQDAILETSFCAALENDLSTALAFESELHRIDANSWQTARRFDVVLAQLRGESTEDRLAVAWEVLERSREANPSAMWNTEERFLRIAEGRCKED